ncbi:MAG: tetratricopeptide repeat protein [Treponemataceae bacterium]|nr:tetratricopeptide repeat protein [Treponemataceae bacterium]
MKKKFQKLLALCIVMFCMLSLSAQNSQGNLLVQGLEAYRKGDWNTALFFLRKAATMPENSNQETWYVLIMSEVFSGDYQSVLTDGSYYTQRFPESGYLPQVKYQMARSEYLLNNYTDAVRDLTSFCNTYPDHELVPSALFWMAECLYQTFNFDQAERLFERIVTEYPQSAKTVESVFRLELLNQREREEKLLYLLRVTGEEYLASKEEYERLLKQYQSEEALALRSRVRDMESHIQDLELALASSQEENAFLNARVTDLTALNEQLRTAAEDTLNAVAYAAELNRISALEEQELEESEETAEIAWKSPAESEEDTERQREFLELMEKARKLQGFLDETHPQEAY